MLPGWLAPFLWGKQVNTFPKISPCLTPVHGNAWQRMAAETRKNVDFFDDLTTHDNA
jgi:hypothetical protein